MDVEPGSMYLGLNLNPFGGRPLEGWSFTGCAIFAVWGSEMTRLMPHLQGPYIRGWVFLLCLQGSWKKSTFGIHPAMHNLERTCHFLTGWGPWSWKKPHLVLFCHFWQMVLKGDFYLCHCEGSWKESQIVHFKLGSWKNLMNSLERTWIYFSASCAWCFAINVEAMVLKGVTWSWFLWLK